MAGAVAVGIWSLVNFWDWLQIEQVGETGGRESGSTTVRNIGLVVAGAVALPLGLWRSIVANRQSVTAQQGLLNERYQQGAEMLGSNVLAVRLGGIYALQRLAKEHPQQYHIQIMQLLCAFVRHPTEHEEIEISQNLRQDIQAALHAISGCHRDQSEIEHNENYRLELQNSNTSYGILANLDLSRAIFLGANLSYAILIRSDLSGADISQANLCSADLTDSNLNDASIWSSDLTKTNLRGTSLYRANLVGLDLSQCRLNGSILSHALLNNVNMTSADLADSDLSCIHAQSSIFTKANIRRSILSFAGLHSATMRGVCLDRSNLYSTDLFNADLRDASLRRANFCNANLRDAQLSNADLSGAQFSKDGAHPAKGLTQSQLDLARADSNHPPRLDGVVDAESGEPLVWRDKPPDDEA